MSRLKSIRWNCVPAWLSEFCTKNGLSVDHAAVAGGVISYSLHKRAPIFPSHSSLWRSIRESRDFDSEALEYVRALLSDLLAIDVLFETSDGKLMPGSVAFPFEISDRDDYSTYWCPLTDRLAAENLIISISTSQGTNKGTEQ